MLGEHVQLCFVRFRLGEVVVQHDVDLILDRLVRVQLYDGDAVAVLIEHVCQSGEDDVVVIDQSSRDRARRLLRLLRLIRVSRLGHPSTISGPGAHRVLAGAHGSG